MTAELWRLVAKAKQLGFFEGFDQNVPEGLKRRQAKPRRGPRKLPEMEAPEQMRFDFLPATHTLKELRAVIKLLNEGELPGAKKDGATAAMRLALKAHPTNALAAINAMRKTLEKMGFPDDKAKQIAVTEIRGAVNSLLFRHAKNHAESNGVRLLKRWKHNDHLVKDPRHNHKVMDGATVPIDEPFALAGADGVTYYPQYPHDGVLPAGEVINCQCTYDIIRERKPAGVRVLKALLSDLKILRARAGGRTLIRKAGGHKYIRREGAPGDYTYYYADGESAGGERKDKPSSQYENDEKKPADHILNEGELKDFIDRALKTKENEKAKIGVINEKTREKIKEICGEEVSHIEADMEHIRHALNKPAHNLETSDILLSEQVINNALEVNISDKSKKGLKALEFKADIDGAIYFIEGVHRKGDGFLSLITCYRQKKARRGPTEIQKRCPGAYVQNGAPPAFNTASHKSDEKSSGKISERTAALKSILHSLTVWKRRTYKIGDVRENPRTGRKEVKRFTGRGKDNWVPAESGDARTEKTDVKERMEKLEAFQEKDPVKMQELFDGVQGLPDETERVEALKAMSEILKPARDVEQEPAEQPSPEEKQADEANAKIAEAGDEIIDAANPVEAAESLPKTKETLEAVKTAVEYFVNGGGTNLEAYGKDYGSEAFPDNFTEEQKRRVDGAASAYKKENPNAKLAWDVRGYLMDFNAKPKRHISYTLEDGKEKKVLRFMAPDEERTLDYMLTRPNEVKSFFHLINPAVRRKLFKRFPPADVPALRQRDRLLEIARKIKSGEYDRAGSDMEDVKDEELAAFDSPEANDEDNKKRLERLNREWKKKRGVEGGRWEANGRKGRWRLVEADAPAASHNEKTFEQSKDFPHNQDGRTMNDRDYRVETNKEAVEKFAEEFDGRALAFDDPVTVSPDGVVLSGNNRTMSSKLAAEKGTDKAYLDRLRKVAGRMGFSAEQLERFKHPRAVFELDEMDEPYSTSLFASFNTEDKKRMDAETAAKKASAILAEKKDVVGKIAGGFGKYDNVKKLYDDPDAAGDMINSFIESGVITIADKGKYVANSGALTESGQTFVENTLLASVAKPDDLTRLNAPGMASVKNAVMRALPKLLKNEGARKDLSGAIDIMRQAIRNKTAQGDKPDEMDIRDAAAGGMFDEGKPQSQIDMAMKLNGNENDLNRSLGGAEQPAPARGAGRAAEETARLNAERVKPIREKFEAAKRIQGAKHSIMVGADEMAGEWELVEADAPTASHDERTFRSSENFPENELGRNVNDRDYARDADAQSKVLEYAADYNGNALGIDEPVVVSPDGVVLSGNNRTMSSKLAAEKGTDKKYVNALSRRAQSFGFTPEQVSQFKHPRVVFRVNDNLPYTTETFARFNLKSKKGQNEEEMASKVAKVVDGDTADKIAARIRGGGMSDFLSDPAAVNSVLDHLVARDAISSVDKNTLANADGVVSNEGKVFFQNAFLAMALGEGAMHKMYWNGMNGVRSVFQELSPAIARSKSLPPDYAIDKEINEAIDMLAAINRKRKTYPNIEAYAEKHKGASPLAVFLAGKIDRQDLRPEDLGRLVKSLKENSRGADMWGEKPTKRQVVEAFVSRSVKKARARSAAIKIVKAWLKVWKISQKSSARKGAAA